LPFRANTCQTSSHSLNTQADIANDNKAAQLDDNVNTLLGLDNNRLCRWDMRDRRGVVQVGVWGRGQGKGPERVQAVQ
jgi:hypothetical protein